MKTYQYIVVSLLLLITALLFIRRRKNKGSHVPTLDNIYSHIHRPSLLQVDDSAERALECKYQPGETVSKSVDVIDIVNKRMRLLKKIELPINTSLINQKNTAGILIQAYTMKHLGN